MLYLSVAARNLQLNALRAAINGGAIYIYSGGQPPTPSYAPTGTLLGVISNNGDPYTIGSTTNGLLLASASGAFLAIDPAQTWAIRGLTDGLAGWARFVSSDDTLAYSATLPRIDMKVNDSGMGLLLENPAISNGEIRPVDYWTYGIPPFE